PARSATDWKRRAARSPDTSWKCPRGTPRPRAHRSARVWRRALDLPRVRCRVRCPLRRVLHRPSAAQRKTVSSRITRRAALTIRKRLVIGSRALGGRRTAAGTVPGFRVRSRWRKGVRSDLGTFVMCAAILVLGAYLLYPILILLVLSFDTARDILAGPTTWGIDNWTNAWRQPRLLPSLWNSFVVWFLVTVIAFPVA